MIYKNKEFRDVGVHRDLWSLTRKIVAAQTVVSTFGVDKYTRMRWSRSMSDCKLISRCLIQSQRCGQSRVWGRHQERHVLVEDKRVIQIWPSGARSRCIVHSVEDSRDGVQGVVAPKFVRFTPRVRLSSCYGRSFVLEDST